jgi:hypothetical protein
MAAIPGLMKLSLFRHPTKIFVYCTVYIHLSFLHPPPTYPAHPPPPYILTYILTYLLTYLLSSICELVRGGAEGAYTGRGGEQLGIIAEKPLFSSTPH